MKVFAHFNEDAKAKNNLIYMNQKNEYEYYFMINKK